MELTEVLDKSVNEEEVNLWVRVINRCFTEAEIKYVQTIIARYQSEQRMVKNQHAQLAIKKQKPPKKLTKKQLKLQMQQQAELQQQQQLLQKQQQQEQMQREQNLRFQMQQRQHQMNQGANIQMQQFEQVEMQQGGQQLQQQQGMHPQRHYIVVHKTAANQQQVLLGQNQQVDSNSFLNQIQRNPVMRPAIRAPYQQQQQQQQQLPPQQSQQSNVLLKQRLQQPFRPMMPQNGIRMPAQIQVQNRNAVRMQILQQRHQSAQQHQLLQQQLQQQQQQSQTQVLQQAVPAFSPQPQQPQQSPRNFMSPPSFESNFEEFAAPDFDDF